MKAGSVTKCSDRIASGSSGHCATLRFRLSFHKSGSVGADVPSSSGLSASPGRGIETAVKCADFQICTIWFIQTHYARCRYRRGCVVPHSSSSQPPI